MVTKATNARNCMKEYYKHSVPTTCFGGILCLHFHGLFAFVGFVTISNSDPYFYDYKTILVLGKGEVFFSGRKYSVYDTVFIKFSSQQFLNLGLWMVIDNLILTPSVTTVLSKLVLIY